MEVEEQQLKAISQTEYEMFDSSMLSPISEEELGIRFDSLTVIIAEQPDSQIAIVALQQLMKEVKRTGRIEMAMQMAMTVGALACSHQHMETIAKEFEDIFNQDGLFDGTTKGSKFEDDDDDDENDENTISIRSDRLRKRSKVKKDNAILK